MSDILPNYNSSLSRYEGKIESVENNVVLGWIYDSQDPHRTLFIDVWVEGRKVCTAVANEPRDDLKALGKGNHSCGFAVPLPAWVAGDDVKSIRVSVLGFGADVPGWSARLTGSKHQPAQEVGNSDVFYRVPQRDFRPVRTAKALVGKDNWLFLANDSNVVLDQLRGKARLSPATLEQHRRALIGRCEKFRQLKIPYAHVVAPTKELIYADKLPDGFELDIDGFPMSQIIAAAEEIGFNIKTLHRPLKAARETYGDVFFRTDTHWNSYGGYAAYLDILKQIAPLIGAIDPLPLEAFRFEQQAAYRGDLADKPKVLFMPHNHRDLITVAVEEFPPELFSETIMALKGGALWQSSVAAPHLRVSKSRATTVNRMADKTLPKVVVFHDSFTLNVMPFLSNHFSESIYIWRPDLDFDLIAKEKPDIVLSITLDRFMRIVPAA